MEKDSKSSGLNKNLPVLFKVASIIIIVAILAIIAITLIVLTAFFLIANPSDEGQNQSQGILEQATNVQDPLENGVESNDDSSSLWEEINTPLVEGACLNEAKSAAGNFEAAVFSCSCSGSESSSEKSYECSILAIDGFHELTADCSKQTMLCTISSEQGTFTLPFDQLKQIIG